MVHDANKAVKRPYLYFLVEEGFRKNTASDRMRDYLAVKFCERAEIEMRYIKLLQDWLGGLAPPRDRQDGAEVYMDMEAVKRLTTSLESEAKHTVDARQSVYDSLMAEDGPYSRLQAMGSAAQKDKASFTANQLREMFAHLDAKRTSTEKEHKRNTDAREHLRHKIEELESQLSQRSRLTSRRPPTRTGSRNVDDMRSRLSSLRQKNDDIQKKIDMLEHELETMQKSAEQPLTNMDRDLREMDMAKMKTLVQQAQCYLSHLGDLNKRKQLPEPLEVSPDALKAQWTEVQANARRLEVGEQFKLRELFAVGSQRPKSRMDGLITKPLASKAPASEIRSELASLQSRVFETCSSAASDEVSVDRLASPAPSSPGRFWPDSARRSDSTCSMSDKPDHVTDIVTDHVSPYEGDRRRTPAHAWSYGSIEELMLPPEVVCPGELSRLEPNKQYAPKTRLTRPRHESPVTHITEYIPVSRFSSEEYGESSPDDVTDVAKQREIRVVAKTDNLISPGSAELPFKKGQVIKQKAGANEDGYCYGWTRDHMIGRKQYGYYHPEHVRLFRPGDNDT